MQGVGSLSRHFGAIVGAIPATPLFYFTFSLHPSTSNTLGDLDGAGRAIIDAAIKEALNDLDDRGNDEQPPTAEVKDLANAEQLSRMTGLVRELPPRH